MLKALEGADQPLEGDEMLFNMETVAAWHPADYAGDARILLWGVCMIIYRCWLLSIFFAFVVPFIRSSWFRLSDLTVRDVSEQC